MIDRSLNYGPQCVRRFLSDSLPFNTVLDLGAGGGRDLGIAKSIHAGAQLNAVEFYPEYIKLLESQGIRVVSVNLEVERLPFSDASLDIVIANQVLEHVKELFWICHEVSRVLKIGGSFIIGVPNLASLHNRVLLAAGRQPSSIKNWSAHIRGFTKTDLCDFFSKGFSAGYELKGFGGSNFYPFPPVLAVPLARLFPNLSYGVFFRFQKMTKYSGEFLKYLDEAKLETNFFRGSAA